MAETKTLLPVAGETAASAADPYAGALEAVNPYAAQALTTNILPPFAATPAGRGEAPPQPMIPEKAPEDPYAGATEVKTADPFAGAAPAGESRGYDIAKLKSSKVEDLVKDKSEFNPVEFYAKNTDALLADPQALKLVEDAYEQREKERMTAGQFAKAVATAPFHPIETAKTVGKIVKGTGEFIGELGKGVGQVFTTAGKAAGALSAGDLKETAARAAEVVDAFDSAQQHWVTTLTSKLLPRPENIRERLAYDADFKRKELAAAAGNGELAHALGTDQESLKASGVTLDPEAIKKLSVIEDPMFLVPVGGVIGVVSKSGKFLLGKAISPAAAEAFAKVTNAVLERAAGGTVELAGKGIEKIGAGTEKLGEVAGKAASNLGGLGKAALIYHNPVAAIGLAAPTLLKYTGKGIGAVGEAVQGAAPTIGKIGLEGAKGAAEGAALSVPLFIGSTPEEREGLLGMIGGAGALRAGGAALGLGTHAAGQAAQEKLASKVFEAVDRGPIKDSPYYGTDQKLDAAHNEQVQSLPPGQQSVVNWAREFFRDAGVEIYALDNKTFQNHVPNVAGAAAAEGFFTTRGERINADGTRQPVVQVLLNGETNGLGHELYHAFKSLDPASAQALESHISKTWSPEEQTWIADTYNAALNGGKPKSQWTVEYDKKQILEEAAAEVFGRVLNATDLSGVRPSVVKRATEFASRALDKMGYPLAGKALPAGPGVSALGVRPGHSELKVARDFLGDMAQRVKEGTLSPPKPIARGPENAPGAPRTSPKAAAPPSPSEPPPAAPAPKPATPPPGPAPAAPAENLTPNIRVTPKEQLDYAAERSQVTNADTALAKAAPEQRPAVQTINDSMANGHGVEIVHKGVVREGGPSPEKPVARGTRRAEQEEAYIAEAMGGVPDDIREQHQKVLFGTRWQETGKSGLQLTARSLDKVLANVKNAADMAADKKVALPYEVDAAGKLTEAGWHEVVQDLKDYWGNQDRGFRGDGERLVRPATDIGVSLPPEDPRGPAATLTPEKTDFLNLVQGLNIPETPRQTKGKIPGNVKGQLLAEAQGRKPATPAGFTAADVQRATFKPIEGVAGIRSIAEVNPLRNELRAAGAPVGNLIEVTENVNLKNIESVTPRPDVPGSGGSTDIARAGFSVNDVKAEVARRLEEKRKAGVAPTEIERRKTQQEVERDLRGGKKLGPGEAAGFFSVKTVDDAKEILDQPPEEWTKTAQNFKGGLTQEAYRLGLGLTDRADLATLADYAKKANDEGRAAMADGDMDGAMASIMKGQFFREAWEAAQGIASAKVGIKRSPEFEGAKPPFLAEGQSFSPATAKGQELEKQGFDFKFIGDKGDRTVVVKKDGESVGYLNATTSETRPNVADVAMTNVEKKFRGKGLGEALYREMFAQLQKDGIEHVEGMVVAPEPIAIRNKIFGGRFEKLEGGGEPLSVPDALLTAADIKKGASTYVPGIDVVNRIRPEDRFSVRRKEEAATPVNSEGETRPYDVIWKPRKEGKTVIKQKVQATSPEEATAKANIPEGAHHVSTEKTYAPGINPEQKVQDSFSPALAGAEPSKASQEKARKAWVEQGTESPYFKKWFGKSEVVDPYKPSDPLVVYHGTTHEFTEFKPDRGNLDNDFGKGYYFTSSAEDVGRNYAGEGPDLTQRIEETADRIQQDHEDISRDEALVQAKKQVAGQHEGAVIPAYLAIKKPFRVGMRVSGVEETRLTTNFRGTGTLDKFLKSLEEQGIQYDSDIYAGLEEIRNTVDYDHITASQLIKTIRDSEHFMAEDPETGKLVRSQMVREALEAAGFDGIIDETVSDKFKGMQLQPDTVHYIAFKPEQIKSATGNVGTFRKTSTDMRFSPSRVPTDKEITTALSEDKKPLVGAARDLKPGTPVGLRIDIPAYTRSGTYVITVHEKAKGGNVGKRIGYDSIATVDNPTFFSNEKGAEKIRAGAAKFPIATVEGEYNPSREIPSGPEWTEAGYNPTKHSYFYEKGTEEPVVSGSQAVSVGNSVFVKDAKFGNKADYSFSAAPEKGGGEVPEERIAQARTGEHVTQKKIPGTPEYNAFVENKIAKSKNFPEAHPLEFRKDKNGNYLAEWDGEPLPVSRPYNLLKSDLAEKSGGKKEFEQALADKLEHEYHEAKKDPAIAEGEFWYSRFREKVGHFFGDDSKFFAELLGATSPQQGVGPNFKDALEAYNRFKRGDYDGMLAKYREGQKKFADGDLAEFTAETGKKGAKADKKSFMSWWQKKNNLIPTKANGKKFGMNSRAVMKVLDRSWLEGVEGPKTPNFTGNLAGTTFKATIDVWAMRTLHRLANEGSGKPWRIQPSNETGVADPEFYFGQDVFQNAADKLGIKADALQAIIWFAEKDRWEKRGWTAAAGKAKSDYNTLLDRTTKSPEGQFTITPEDVKPKAAKKAKTIEASDVQEKK
jgi:predicted GNAT family acetyltransferase